MEPQEYERMYAVEGDHWWYRGMRGIRAAMLPTSPDARVLDAGCGTGGDLAFSGDRNRGVGIDASRPALHLASARGLRCLAGASVCDLPFASGVFDVLWSHDVLYHRGVRDTGRALREFHRVLRPGGRIFLRLPAFRHLWRHHDDRVHAARRFTRAEVERLLRSSGFSAIRSSYANTLLFPVAVVRTIMDSVWGMRGSDLQQPSQAGNRILEALLGLEACWLRRRSFPFGLSVVAVAQKPIP